MFCWKLILISALWTATTFTAIGAMKPAKDPYFCDPNPYCKDISAAGAAHFGRPSSSGSTHSRQNIPGQTSEKKGEKVDKKYEEAAEMAKKSASKMLELALQAKMHEDISSMDLVKIMLEMASPLAEFIGGPFGTTLVGVLLSEIPSNNPALKAIAELNAEMNRQFALAAKRIDNMVDQIIKAQAEICYFNRVDCVRNKLLPHFNDVISTASSGNIELYKKAVESFLTTCTEKNEAYDALSYIASAVEIEKNCKLKNPSHFKCLLFAIYKEDKKRDNLLKTAMIFQIDAILLSSIAILCTELRKPNEFTTKHIMETTNTVLHDTNVWINHTMFTAWPEIFKTTAIEDSVTTMVGERKAIAESEMTALANKIQTTAHELGLDGYKYYVLITRQKEFDSPFETDETCHWDLHCPTPLSKPAVLDEQYTSKEDTSPPSSMCIVKFNYMETNILLVRTAFDGQHTPIKAPGRQIFNVSTYDRTDRIFNGILRQLPEPNLTAAVLITDKHSTINKCPLAFVDDDGGDVKEKIGYMSRATEFGYPYFVFLFFASVNFH